MTWMVETDTATMIRDLLKRPFLVLPPREQKVGSSTVSWWEGPSDDAIIMAVGGSCDDRHLAEQVVKSQLQLFGLERVAFSIDGSEELRKTAGWPDIMAKAKRLIQSNNVTILRNGFNNVVGHVIGDHGEYTTEIGRDDPEARAITTWTCECPWDQYAWQRTRKWKKYEGRPCAHVMALYWKSLATPLDDYDPEQHGDLGTGQKMGPPPEEAPPGGGGGPPSGGPVPGSMPTPTPGAPPVPAPPGAGQAPMAPGAPPPMAPPAPPGILPPSPMDQLQMQQPPMPGMTPGGMPSPPGSVSIPGAKPQTPFNPIQYPGGTYSKMSQYERYMKDIAEAYANAPTNQPEAQRAWQELAEDSKRRADEIRGRLNVSVTDESEPYATPQHMFDDINRGNFTVSRAHSEHPLWTPEQNVDFRIVHDVLGHHTTGADFSWGGENKACAAHSPLLSKPAQAALFSECIGQTAYANQYGGFGPQKTSFIHQPFMNQQTQSSGGLCHRHIRHGTYRLSKISSYKERGLRERWNPGDTAHFEYHCYQGHDSGDAQAWYRSHQPVQIVGGPFYDDLPEQDSLTQQERFEAGSPNTYKVRFSDGHEHTAFEDELYEDPQFWTKGYEPPPEGERRLSAEFQPPEIVRLKNEVWGMAEGKSEEYGAGQYQPVPEGSTGEVLGQDPSTGWVECIFPLEGGPMTPYHVRCFVEPSDLEASRQSPPGPFIKRHR